MGCEKTSMREQSKNLLNHAVDRPKMHVVRHILFQELLLTQGKVHVAKMLFVFEILGILIFALCVLPSAARSLKRTRSTGGSKLGFWDRLAHFEVEGGRNFGSGCVSQNSRFHHALSVCVVPSESVESVIESVML